MEVKEVKKKSGLATAGMVLGIIAIVLSFIPIINNVAFVLGVLALIFGAIALLKKASKGKAITALILGILSIVITILMQQAFSNAINDATKPTKTTTDSSSQSRNKLDEKQSFDGNAMFDKIQTGMTKDEVRTIAGIDPSSCTESQDPTLGTTEYCSYGNLFKDKVTVSVVYAQGKLQSKSKSSN